MNNRVERVTNYIRGWGGIAGEDEREEIAVLCLFWFQLKGEKYFKQADTIAGVLSTKYGFDVREMNREFLGPMR